MLDTTRSSTVISDPARLQAVQRTALLDTPPEAAFDRLTRLAARILDAPVALISLLDENRLFFKSSVGLPDPKTKRSLPLAQTFCQNNVTLKQPLVIEDALTHALVFNNPAVKAFDVRGYLGVPLFDSEGHGLGALCVFDHRPRAWSADQIDIIQELAATVITEIELRIAGREAEGARAQVTTILEGITGGFVALDSGWRFTYINAESERLMGRPRAEFIGKNHWQLFPSTLGTSVETEYRRAMENRVTVEFENYYAPWHRWFDIKASPSTDGGLSIFFQECSERKQIEAEARAAGEQLRLITDALPALISYIDKDGYYRLNNRAYESWFGQPRAEITGKPVREIMGETAWATVQPRIEAALAGQTVSYDVQLPYKSGGTRWVNATYSPHIDRSGEVMGVAVLVNDVSANKQAEAVLRDSEQRFRTIVNQALTGVVQADTTGRMTLVNQRWCDMVGFSEVELLEMSIIDITDSVSVAPTLDAVSRLATGGPDFVLEKRYRRKDGSGFWALSSVSALRNSAGEYLGLVAVVLDITARKQAEEALRESTARLNFTLQSAQIGDWDLDLINDTATRSLRHDQAFGYDELQEQWGYGKFLEHVHPADRATVDAKFSTALAEHSDWHFECRVIWPDGSLHWIEAHGSVYHTSDGKPAHMLGIVANITARKQAEATLLESEARFRTLADNMSQFAWMGDEKGWIFWYNQRWFDYTGTTLEQMQGWGWQEVHHPDHVQRVVDKIRHCFDNGSAWEDTFPLRGQDGSYRWFLSRALPIRDDAGKVLRWFGTNTDITEQREAELALHESRQHLANFAQQLQRSNRELNDFSSVASHDLQEPLRKIQSFGDRLRSEDGQALGPQGLSYLSRMQKAASRMQELIEDLLSYSRVSSKASPFVPVVLEQVVQSVIADLELLVAETKATITVGALPTIAADPTQIRQLFQNLIGNALKFHKPDVAPLISIQAKQLQEGRGNWVCELEVSDNGIGFDEQYCECIFTVFERLHGRHEYEGTGIGLAICRRIAERHGGSITARSQPGLGSSFIVSLPVEQLRD